MLFQLAITAKYHQVPFYVCAPKTSVDINIKDGSAIKIEERPSHEITMLNGKQIAAKG